ncbi:MAG: 30S ribosomal protein S2 [Nanoarchaeota archaeon]
MANKEKDNKDILEKIEKEMNKEAEVIKNVEQNVEEGIETVEKIAESEKEVKNIIEDIDEKHKKKSKKETAKKTKLNISEKELIDATEAESLATEETSEDKRKKLLEKAKKLAEKIEITTTEELKEKVKGKKKTETLLPLEDYVKAGIYLGTRVVTPQMKQYVYRRRADGLAILNTDTIDEMLKEGIEYISKFNPEEIIVVCKRQAGWKAVEMFSKFTGIRAFTKKYPAGILTNIQLPNFFEAELAIVCDSWLDKNALLDMKRVGKKVLMICDTNNFPTGVDKRIIGNNKSNRSLGLIFYLLTKSYCKAHDISTDDIPELEVWTEDDHENLINLNPSYKIS